jgi:nicotinamidase-related amidase
MKTALLLIDIQNDYFPGGKMELEGPLEAARRAIELLGCFRDHGLPTVHIQHVSLKPDATTFLPGDRGTDIHDTNLLELLRGWGIERVIVTGMMTHMCVDATARAAADLGFELMVAEDACATRALTYGDMVLSAEHVHKAFLAALRSYGQILPVEGILARLAMELIP